VIHGEVRITTPRGKPVNVTGVFLYVTPTCRRTSTATDLEHCTMSSITRPAPSDTTAPAARPSSEAHVLVVAARPDSTGLAAAQVLAERLGADATHAGATGLDAAVRDAAEVIVLDPSLRARLTRDPAFTAKADPASRRDLLSRLAPYQDRVRWMSRPA
jgi:hypothetical protein